MRVLKTITWDGIVSYNVYRHELVGVIDRLNNGARTTATKYEIIDVSDEEAARLGLISNNELKKSQASEIEKLRAEIAALKSGKLTDEISETTELNVEPKKRGRHAKA